MEQLSPCATTPSPSAAVTEAWAPIAHAVLQGSHPEQAYKGPQPRVVPLPAATRENQR